MLRPSCARRRLPFAWSRLLSTKQSRNKGKPITQDEFFSLESDWEGWKPPAIPTSIPTFPPILSKHEGKETLKHVREMRGRAHVFDFDTAYAIADTLVPEGSVNKTIIEMYPGPGVLTRALLSLPRERIASVITCEGVKEYVSEDFLAFDPRLQFLRNFNGNEWELYGHIVSAGLVPPAHPWKDGVHPNLHYIAHLPGNASGEQFLSQILRHIPSKAQFIWSQGRVPMSLILGRDIWNRCSAATHHTIRSRLSVVAQATCDLRVPIPPSFFDNAEEVFFPPQFVRARTTKGRMTANGEHQKVPTGPSRPLVATFTPRAEQVIEPQDMPIWDFILRRLFVTPAMPLEKALPQLAPGARNLLDKLSGPTVAEEDRVAIKKKPRDLNIEEVHRIVRAFKNWPFAPKDLAVDKDILI